MVSVIKIKMSSGFEEIVINNQAQECSSLFKGIQGKEQEQPNPRGQSLPRDQSKTLIVTNGYGCYSKYLIWKETSAGL